MATTLRIDEELYEKIVKLANMEERSINSQMLYIFKKYIEEYEKENGEIKIKFD